MKCLSASFCFHDDDQAKSLSLALRPATWRRSPGRDLDGVHGEKTKRGEERGGGRSERGLHRDCATTLL